MKRIVTVILALTMPFSLACANAEGSSHVLVAYFSATNNTEGVAQKLSEGLGADIYDIVPEIPYTDDDLNYNDSSSRSSVEMDDPSMRPAIAGELPFVRVCFWKHALGSFASPYPNFTSFPLRLYCFCAVQIRSMSV